LGEYIRHRVGVGLKMRKPYLVSKEQSLYTSQYLYNGLNDLPAKLGKWRTAMPHE
jgi:hypothetical protein